MKIYQKTTFSAAHRLLGYNGSCNQLHGHLWAVEVTIESCDNDLDECSMLLDYREIKKIIADRFDHTTVLNNKDPLIDAIRSCGCSVTEIEGNPTAENLAIIICESFMDILMDYDYVEISVHESPDNYASVNSEDLWDSYEDLEGNDHE